MANPYINKVVLGNETLLDLTADTVTPQTLYLGTTAHDASGTAIVGTLDSSSGSVYQDADGYLVVDDSESSAPQGNLSITANGTYDVADYAGASVAIPVGMTETDLRNFIQRSNSFTDITWPSGITAIGGHVFAQCGSFRPSSLPSGITTIGTYAFYNCTNLALTSLPDGVTRIESYAFQGCTNLALTSLPDGVTNIGNNAFYNCTNLALTSLPDGVKIINNYAFQGCSGITSISCDGAITTLAQASFTGTSGHPMNLVSVSFPNLAITSNLGTVFGSTTAANACQLLEFCDIGSTVGIASSAFANCYALQTLVLRKSDAICTLANVSAFTNTPMSGYNNLTGTVYVPQALISTYQTATNWSTLYNAGTVTFAAIEGSEYER